MLTSNKEKLLVWLIKITDLIVTLRSCVSVGCTWAGVGVVLLGLAIVSTGRGFLGLLTIVAGGIAIFLNERSE